MEILTCRKVYTISLAYTFYFVTNLTLFVYNKNFRNNLRQVS